MTIEGDFILFEFDNEKLFIRIEKLTQEDLEWYELTSLVSHIKRKHGNLVPNDIPVEE